MKLCELRKRCQVKLCEFRKRCQVKLCELSSCYLRKDSSQSFHLAPLRRHKVFTWHLLRHYLTELETAFPILTYRQEDLPVLVVLFRIVCSVETERHGTALFSFQ